MKIALISKEANLTRHGKKMAPRGKGIFVFLKENSRDGVSSCLYQIIESTCFVAGQD